MNAKGAYSQSKMRSIAGLLLLLGVTFAQSDLKFPDYFQFGVATSSYQIEGAWNVNGKGENIWDHLTHTESHLIKGQANGDIACDSYHKVKEDVRMIKELGVDFYRFSLSWSRILPTGFANHINPDGIRYYNELIDELLANGITPFATLYHWDLPQPLQEIGGWPNSALEDIFVDYARVAFDNFGDRVKDWLTFNEPIEICDHGYSLGGLAPAYHSNGIACYLCSHTLLLAHAKAWHLYDDEYRSKQNGRIAITIDSKWDEPDSPDDADAAERALLMDFGWWANAIFSTDGDYPKIMRERIDKLSAEEGFPRSRLVPFTAEQVEYIKGTSDFFGLNHYTSRVVIDQLPPDTPTPSHARDVGVHTYQRDEWGRSAADWLRVNPEGLRRLLNWIKKSYNSPEIVITENGFADDSSDGLDDCGRINYYNKYLEQILLAIKEDGVNVTGYTAWSLMDNFEWFGGYGQRFGLYYVNFNDPNRPRCPKQSAYVYSNIATTKTIDFDYTPIGFEVCPKI